jgi:hypothetical protein
MVWIKLPLREKEPIHLGVLKKPPANWLPELAKAADIPHWVLPR